MTTTSTTGAATTTVDYFESIYAKAAGDPTRLPWAHAGPCPALVNWLNAEAPSQVRCGARVAMVGCGLGDDAREVMRRGYEVIGFDCSETAIRWARKLDPDHVDGYVQADLFNPPARWVHRFDLVIEIDNLHVLSPDRHAEAIKALGNLMTPHGLLLVVARGGDVSAESGLKRLWPITEEELRDSARAAGLQPVSICSFMDDEDPPVKRIRAVFRRR